MIIYFIIYTKILNKISSQTRYLEIKYVTYFGPKGIQKSELESWRDVNHGGRAGDADSRTVIICTLHSALLITVTARL
jgi:hypothetical protein